MLVERVGARTNRFYLPPSTDGDTSRRHFTMWKAGAAYRDGQYFDSSKGVLEFFKAVRYACYLHQNCFVIQPYRVVIRAEY